MITKNNIIVAALRLFLRRGYKYVSLVDVAKEVGITKGGIYHYFNSKEELLHVSMHFLFDCFEERYNQLVSQSKNFQEFLRALIVEEQLEDYAKELLGVEGDYRINYASFAIEVVSTFPDIQERVESSHLHFCNSLEQQIHKALDNGEIRQDLDSKSLAVIILSFLSGQSFLGLHFKTISMRKQIMDSIWKLLT